MNFHQIEVGQAINQPTLGQLVDTPKITRVNLIDIAVCELSGSSGHVVEHLISSIEVVNRAQNEVEPFPILLDPPPSVRARLRIIV